jgi:transcription factor TFIIIB component B''
VTADPPIVPSIEHEIEQLAPALQEATQPTEDVEGEEPSSRAPPAAPQITSTAPLRIRQVTYAKKTSEITRGRGKASVLATPPSSQGVVPTIEGSSETPASSVTPSTPEPSQATAKGKGKRKVSKAGTDADGSEQAKKVRRRKREPTPEGAERVEILPNVVKMSELCKDLKTGRKSKRETELRKLEIEEQERKWKAQEEGTAGTPVKKTAEPEKQEDRLPPPKPQAGPVMRIVNGEIVLDTASLEVDRHADAARTAGDLEDVVENQLTRKINQATYGKRSKTETWDEELTDLFYRGLRMFGTDFMVISKLFPGRSRRQIKLKFNNEERRDPQRIKDTLLGPRETIDIKTYSEMTQQTFDDPKIIQQELDDEKKRIEEEHEKEKQLQEDLMRNPTGTGKDENAEGDKAPTKVKGRGKKAKAQSGGTEEVLGSIDDIPMA